jgi:hypothetical protein
MTLGQVLHGDRLVNSLYNIQMLKNVPRTTVCERDTSPEDIDTLKKAIDQNYMFELFVGNLPIGIKSAVDIHGDGKVEDRYFIVNYFDFVVGHNLNQSSPRTWQTT